MKDLQDMGFSRRPRRTAELNLINLIDMLFFLLIFFVLTSTFTEEMGLDINKPKASSSQILSKQPILIGITREGNIHVNESPVTLRSLGTVLKRFMAQDPNRSVVIVADREASIAATVDVLDECNLADVKKVSISSVKE